MCTVGRDRNWCTHFVEQFGVEDMHNLYVQFNRKTKNVPNIEIEGIQSEELVTWGLKPLRSQIMDREATGD